MGRATSWGLCGRLGPAVALACALALACDDAAGPAQEGADAAAFDLPVDGGVAAALDAGTGDPDAAVDPVPVAVPTDFAGDWAGAVHVGGGRELTVLLRITHDEERGFTITLDSPDQGAFGIPGEDARIEEGHLRVRFPLLGGALDVAREGDDLVGLFSQGTSLPIRLSPTVFPVQARPQLDSLQRDYEVREVTFAGGDSGVMLAGELTLPAGGGSFPAVVLVASLEAEDRDMVIFRHRPYLVLSDRLTRAGIATLRFDNRGRGDSSGDTEAATTEDLAADAAAALEFLRQQAQVDAARSGFVGHTEGALASVLADAEPAFQVLLASPTQPAGEVLMRRSRDLGRLMGVPEDVLESQQMVQQELFEALRAADSAEAAHAAVVQLLVNAGASIEAAVRDADRLVRPWLLWILDYDPLPALRELTHPALALFGEKDLIVAADANAPDMETALGHPDSSVQVLAGLNHFFQPAEQGGPGEYADIEITFDEAAMQLIADWIVGQQSQ